MKVLTPNDNLLERLNRLKTVPSPLYYRGENPNLFTGRPMVAVVGTRKPTPYGKITTERLVADLVKAGVTIISGLAFGVDSIAHKTAIANDAKTIAVLPSGVENVYPVSNRHIATEIEQNGCLLSQFEPRHKPRKSEFIVRNNLIAALSDAVIITEAAERSGSLSTARRAKKLDIPVFAIPGQVNSSMSSGTNLLLKQGDARFIRSAQDALDELGIKQDISKQTLEGRTPLETILLKLVSQGVGDTTLLADHSAANLTDVQTSLTMLEISGRVNQNELGIWQLAE